MLLCGLDNRFLSNERESYSVVCSQFDEFVTRSCQTINFCLKFILHPRRWQLSFTQKSSQIQGIIFISFLERLFDDFKLARIYHDTFSH